MSRHPRTVRALLAIAPALLACALLGCDDRSHRASSATAPQADPQTNPADARPTTRKFLDAPRTRVRLGSLPLTASIPGGWKIGSAGAATFLQGPTPNGPLPDGMLHAQLATQIKFKPEYVQENFRDEQARARKDPASSRLLELRPAGPHWIFEKRSLEPDAPSVFTWKVVVYVAIADGFVPCQISFVDLTPETYEKDRVLLEAIISSIEVDVSVPFEVPGIGEPVQAKPG